MILKSTIKTLNPLKLGKESDTPSTRNTLHHLALTTESYEAFPTTSTRLPLPRATKKCPLNKAFSQQGLRNHRRDKKEKVAIQEYITMRHKVSIQGFNVCRYLSVEATTTRSRDERYSRRIVLLLS